MDDLLREFVGETLDMMDAVAGDLVAWEADPADRSGIDGIFRTVHTVKGSSGFFDIPRISAIAHAAEELLDVLRSRRGPPTRASVAMVLAAFDRIRELTQVIAASGKEPEGEDSKLIAALLADIRRDDRSSGTGQPSPDVPASVTPMGPLETGHDVPVAWRSVRVPVDLLDQLMSGVSDLVLARNELASHLRSCGLEVTELGAFQRLNQLLGSVRATVSSMRMVSLRHLYAPLPRLVRQVADELGKTVRLTLDGGEVEIDREVVESLRDPVLHILRNAIDHGLEAESVRSASGKPAIGHIEVRARQAGNRIHICITDDGAGLALDSLTERAVRAGHLTAERSVQLNDAQRADLAFLPGLSTAEQVTGISGRGVGMDVVKANVERLGGSIRIHNRPGQGVELTLDVPMTLTIISALAVDAGGQSFAIPRSAVDEVMLASNDAVQRHQAGSAGLIRIRDRILPLVAVEHILSSAGMVAAAAEDRALIICRHGHGGAFALEVPDVRDHEELVIKPLPPSLLAVGLYSGLSLPDNGRPMLVLDIDAIAHRHVGAAGLTPFADELSRADQAQTGQAAWLTFADHATARLQALPMNAIERICDVDLADIARSGGRWLATLDGELIPVAGGTTKWADSGKCRMIRISDGCRSLLLPVRQIGEMVAFDDHICPADADATLLGTALVDGRLIELVDSYALLARYGSSIHGVTDTAVDTNAVIVAQSTDASRKMLWIVDPAGGEWSASFLVPTLAAAGYQVAIVDKRESIAEAASTVITVAKEGPTMPLSVELEGVTHRLSAYDRAALMKVIERTDVPDQRQSPRRRKGGRA